MFGKIMSAPLFGSSPNIRWSFSPLSGHPIDDLVPAANNPLQA